MSFYVQVAGAALTLWAVCMLLAICVIRPLDHLLD